MQVFFAASGRREPIVGVVGALQFDVITSRLRTEYAVEVEVETTGYTAARWIGNFTGSLPTPPAQSSVVTDRQGRSVILFGSSWELQYFERQHPGVPLLEESPV